MRPGSIAQRRIGAGLMISDVARLSNATAWHVRNGELGRRQMDPAERDWLASLYGCRSADLVETKKGGGNRE